MGEDNISNICPQSIPALLARKITSHIWTSLIPQRIQILRSIKLALKLYSIHRKGLFFFSNKYSIVNSDFRYAFEQTVNNISIFIVEGTDETTTTQITGGKLAGLVNYYAYVQEIRSSIANLD